MLNQTEEICRKHWQSAEGGLDKACEHRSSVSCGAMVTSITRWRHNTLITFATMQFVFSQQLQKLQKWWKDCDHCRMQETLMSIWQSILLDKWNPVVLNIGVSLLQALCLDLHVHSIRIPEIETSLEVQACWNVMLQWGLVVRNAEHEGSTFVQNIRNHSHKNAASLPGRPGLSTATEMLNAAYKHHCFQNSWWLSVSEVVPSSFIWM